MLLNDVILEPSCWTSFLPLKGPPPPKKKQNVTHQKESSQKKCHHIKKKHEPSEKRSVGVISFRFVSVKLLSVQDLVKIAEELKFEGPSIRGFWRVQDRGARGRPWTNEVESSRRCGKRKVWELPRRFGKIHEYVCKRDAKKWMCFFGFRMNVFHFFRSVATYTCI